MQYKPLKEKEEIIEAVAGILVKGLIIFMLIAGIISFGGWIERLILGDNIISNKIFNQLNFLFQATPPGD